MYKSERKAVFSLRMWKKILWLVVAAVFVCAAVLLLQEQRACCLCNSFRYHAPCLVDLETGAMTELDLYFPHQWQVAELADPQPERETFSFIKLGSVSGYRDTAREYIEIDIPVSERTAAPALCKDCRKQLNAATPGRYVLADLYGEEDKRLVSIHADLSIAIRCYRITAWEEQGVLKVTIQGVL